MVDWEFSLFYYTSFVFSFFTLMMIYLLGIRCSTNKCWCYCTRSNSCSFSAVHEGNKCIKYYILDSLRNFTKPCSSSCLVPKIFVLSIWSYILLDDSSIWICLTYDVLVCRWISCASLLTLISSPVLFSCKRKCTWNKVNPHS